MECSTHRHQASRRLTKHEETPDFFPKISTLILLCFVIDFWFTLHTYVNSWSSSHVSSKLYCMFRLDKIS